MANYREDALLTCPFCGGKIKDKSYDRGIIFECEPCSYSRSFPGILTRDKNDHPIPYIDKEGNRVPPENVKTQEYYHRENSDNAIKQMNKRHTTHLGKVYR